MIPPSNTKWAGIVAIERPEFPAKDTPCRIRSARSLDLNGKRAIVHTLPWAAVAHYYTAEDLEFVCVYAELSGEHLQLLERASAREFFTHAPTGIH